MAEPELDAPDMREPDARSSENLEPELQFDLENETAADAHSINDEVAAVRPRAPQDELSLLTAAVAGGKVRTILVAGLGNDAGDRVSGGRWRRGGPISPGRDCRQPAARRRHSRRARR